MIATLTQPYPVQLASKRRCRPTASLDALSGADDPRATLRPSFSPDADAPSPALARRRILAVDNEPASTRMVRLTLERSGLFEVCEVNDPLCALDAARRFQPHLVLLDIEMPGLDGSGVARLLRADHAFRRLPILFMTSLVTEEEAAHRLYAAGNRVLAKPVTISKLMCSVAEMLSSLLTTPHPMPGL